MIRDPYIGMPIIIGGCCDNNNGTGNGNTGGSGNNGGNTGGGNTGNNGNENNGSGNNGGGSGMPSGTGFDARLLGSLPIAMAYTPMQQWKTTYSSKQALNAGTVFPELDLPFQGGRR